jgi:4-amino-4-deoxy-L-arabinose transferase-like glycosyltransferase
MLVWRLTGLVTEQTVRLPFAIAGMLVILLTYLLGRDWFGEAVGLLAALLLALNGLLIAFSRIVQYQQLVLLMNLLAILAIWRWRRDERWWWWSLSGLFVGVGLLFHYDAVLVLPALAYAAFVGGKTASLKWLNVAAGGAALLVVVALFGLPYWQAISTTNTGSYLAGRIGLGLLKNQLYDFFHANSFYSSFYYIILISLLALYFLGVALARLPGVRRWPASHYWLPVAVMAGSLGVVVRPTYPALALGWFLVIFLGTLFAAGGIVAERVAIIWLATTFIGYNFFAHIGF